MLLYFYTCLKNFLTGIKLLLQKLQMIFSFTFYEIHILRWFLSIFIYDWILNDFLNDKQKVLLYGWWKTWKWICHRVIAYAWFWRNSPPYDIGWGHNVLVYVKENRRGVLFGVKLKKIIFSYGASLKEKLWDEYLPFKCSIRQWLLLCMYYKIKWLWYEIEKR